MLKIILVLLAGIALGFGLRKVSGIRHISKSISWTIRGMLFLLGIEVGCNETIINNLSSLGLQALLLTFAGVLGSLTAGWALYKWQFKKDPVLNAPQEDDQSTESKGGHSDCFIVVGLFILGLLVGISGFISPTLIDGKVVLVVLYLLMFQVGISLGYDKTLENAAKGLRPNILLIPLGTIVGTLAFSAVAGLLLSKWSMPNILAASSGFAYYSLSSVLIAEYGAASLGAQMATELGTIALLANIFRELSCIVMTPLYAKWFGKIAPICAAGVTSIDVCLPAIVKSCGKSYMPIAILHGVLVDFTVPFFISFFCSLF